METYVKQRRSIRGLITKTVNALEQDLAVEQKDVIELRIKLGKLNSYQERIEQLDQQILDIMLENPETDDETYDNEVIAIDEYSEQIIKANLRIEMALEQSVNDNRSIADDFQSLHSVNNRKRYKLPKIELKKFSGQIIDWLSWWALFEKIHLDEELSAADKFQYLLQSVEENTRAYDIINSFPATAENYPKAVTALQCRFGNKKLLTQVYIRALFQMGIENLQSKPPISKVYDKLVGHVRSLESLGVTVEQATLFLYPMVESSLSEDIIIAWQRSPLYEADGSAENPPKGNLDYLLEFLRQEVEREDQRNLMKTGIFDVKEKPISSKKQTTYPTAASLHINSTTKIECVFCDKGHPSEDCYSAMGMSLDDKWKTVKQKKACSNCLKKGHWSSQCPENFKCDECSKKHSKILCPRKYDPRVETNVVTSNSSSNNVMNTVVLLKTILVSVNSENGPIVVRVLFDDGSHSSYMTTRLAHRIKAKEVGKFFERNILFGGILSDLEERTIYELSLGALNQIPKYTLELADKEVITGKIEKLPRGYWLKELQENGIWINDVGSNSEAPDILIGADLMPKLTTDKSVTLKCGLKAIETVFGWTILGPIPQTNQIREKM